MAWALLSTQAMVFERSASYHLLAGGFLVVAGCLATSSDSDRNEIGMPDDEVCTECVDDQGQQGTSACTVVKPGEWYGAYAIDGKWNLSAPLTAERGLGDVVAELVVEDALAFLGVPSFAKSKARSVLESAIAQPIRDRVNGSVTDDFLRRDSFFADLIAVTASVQAQSRVELNRDGDSSVVSGVEELERLSVTHRGAVHDFDPALLAGGPVPAPVLALWSGRFNGEALEIAPHSFSVGYGDLLNEIVSDVLGVDAFQEFKSRIAGAVDCEHLVQLLTGGDGEVGVSVLGRSYSVDASPLTDACSGVINGLAGSVFGLLDVDVGVVVGGDVAVADTDCDGVSDKLRSLDNYGGILDLAGPSSLAPRIAVSFLGARSDRVAFADMQNTLGTVSSVPVRGRIVWENGDVDNAHAVPYRELLQDEIRKAKVELVLASGVSLGSMVADGEGYVQGTLSLIDAGLAPGRYTVDVRHNDNNIGRFSMRLLAHGHTQPVVRSDIDLTYLESDFKSTIGLARLMTANANKRETLPAMEVVYSGLADERPISFVSGSPRFFGRVLEGKLAIDGVAQDGVHLKPFKDIVASNILDARPQDVVGDLKEQVGYKLHALFTLRRAVPGTADEILMGDDSEADHIVYSIYARFLSGELSIDQLRTELAAHGVAAHWMSAIEQLLPAVSEVVTTGRVTAIYIRRTNAPGHVSVRDYQLPVTRYHDGTWPMAIDMFEHGWLTRQELQSVRSRLRAIGQSEARLRQAAEDGVAEGFLLQASIEGLRL